MYHFGDAKLGRLIQRFEMQIEHKKEYFENFISTQRLASFKYSFIFPTQFSGHWIRSVNCNEKYDRSIQNENLGLLRTDILPDCHIFKAYGLNVTITNEFSNLNEKWVKNIRTIFLRMTRKMTWRWLKYTWTVELEWWKKIRRVLMVFSRMKQIWKQWRK